MGWFSSCGELIGSATAAFVQTSAKLKQKELVESTDFCPDETKQFISKTLESCRPVNKDLTWWGRKSTELYLSRNDYFGSDDSNRNNPVETDWYLATRRGP